MGKGIARWVLGIVAAVTPAEAGSIFLAGGLLTWMLLPDSYTGQGAAFLGVLPEKYWEIVLGVFLVAKIGGVAFGPALWRFGMHWASLFLWSFLGLIVLVHEGRDAPLAYFPVAVAQLWELARGSWSSPAANRGLSPAPHNSPPPWAKELGAAAAGLIAALAVVVLPIVIGSVAAGHANLQQIGAAALVPVLGYLLYWATHYEATHDPMPPAPPLPTPTPKAERSKNG